MFILAQPTEPGSAFAVGVTIFILLVLLIIFGVLFQFMGLYIRAWVSGARVGLPDLIGMKLRKVPTVAIVNSRIQASRAGINVSTPEMESHVLAGGDVQRVINAMIAANKANIDLPWRTATAIDLAGRDILDAVQTSVNPKVIDVPNPALGRQTIDAVSKDGIQLRVKARVTVRTNIKSLVGGATEETIIARVGEGIVKAIGSAAHHTDVLASPNLISQQVLKSSLDAQTAFEIVSVDVAEIDVGENIGANLQANQAAADLRVAQAKAEERRAAAVAREQEMRAQVEESRAKVVLAEAEIPMAIASAFKQGQLGVMDYYNLRNLQADTEMRASLAGERPGVGRVDRSQESRQ